jgi:hypothetical protein
VTLNKANKSIYRRKAHNKQGNVTVKLIAFDHKQIICLLKGLQKLGAFKQRYTVWFETHLDIKYNNLP